MMTTCHSKATKENLTGLAKHTKSIADFSTYAEYMEHANSSESRVDFTWNLSALKTRLKLLGIKNPTAADWEAAFKSLVSDIKKGVAIDATPMKLEPYSHLRNWENLETTTDIKTYKEKNQIALF